MCSVLYNIRLISYDSLSLFCFIIFVSDSAYRVYYIKKLSVSIKINIKKQNNIKISFNFKVNIKKYNDIKISFSIKIGIKISVTKQISQF